MPSAGAPDLPLPGLPPRATKLNRADEARFSAQYRVGWRQLRRWIERGEHAGERPPLHDPRALLAWWPRHNRIRVPAAIEAAAHAAVLAQVDNPEPAAAANPASEPATPPTPPNPPSPAAPAKPIDLDSMDPEEGDRLLQLKQIQAAKFNELREAFRTGSADCALLEGKYVKLSEAVDKIETRVSERLKRRGLFILRDVVDRDLAAAAELLRQSRASMTRRVLELCPHLDGTPRHEVTAAIERARSSEERILCRLPTLAGGEVLELLAA